jgi:dTDP-4-amino-4,6-dideoxygalactose transaminase
MIPFKVLPLDYLETTAVAKVLASKNLGMGKIVKELEYEFAQYVGSTYAVAVDSCTSALFLSLKYRGLCNNGRLPMDVKIPSMTVPLVANTIIHAGTDIIFLNECDWVGHHYELQPFDIIDSAHEVSKNEFKQFSDKTLLCFSFYPTKPISSCEGGMICTNDPYAVEWLQKARFYGRNSGDSLSRNSWEYDIEFPGWKMNMTEVQAAIALEQLKKLPDLTLMRQRAVDQYNVLLDGHNTSLYLYRIRVKNRNEFIKFMFANGVECGVHFKPLHLMKPFLKYYHKDLMETEIVGNETVSLPLYDSLLPSQVEYISNLVKEWNSGKEKDQLYRPCMEN